MNAVKKLIMSFVYALRGIAFCILTCRNFRIHTVAAALVFYLSRFYDFTGAQYGILFLTIFAVLALEAINTSIENVCNEISIEYSDNIKHAKDAAAGATLLSAICSVAVAAKLFWNLETLKEIWIYHTSKLAIAIISVIIIAAAVIYIFYEDIFRYGKR